MKILTSILFLLIFAFSAFGQCDLTLKDSPTIRGFRLDMPKGEADKKSPNTYGKVRVSKNFIMLDSLDLKNYADFKDVHSIEAAFFEEKLYRLEIVYDSFAVKWKSGKEFAKNLSSNLKLPFKFWTFENENPQQAKMNCKEFSVHISATSNSILLEDLTAKERMRKAEDEKKNTFKP